MQCGISTSCFYPQETAEALSALRGAGVETVEIFLNTFSELELSYTERLRSVLQDAGMRAAALHPFTSGMETFFFASEYGGRLEDGLRIYRRYFEVCRVPGNPTRGVPRRLQADAVSVSKALRKLSAAAQDSAGIWR